MRGAVALALLLVGVALAAAWPGTWDHWSHRLFRIACHQDPTRSVLMAGLPMAVCARCFGVYLGAALGGLAGLKRDFGIRWIGPLWLLLGIHWVIGALGWPDGGLWARLAVALLPGLATGGRVVSWTRTNS